MAKVMLSLDTLGDLDEGRAQAIIDAEIRAAVADLDDRGDDKQKRRVVIELTLAHNKHGRIETTVKAQAKLPPRQVHPTDAKIQRRLDAPKEMGLYFQQDAADNADQTTMEFKKKDGD